MSVASTLLRVVLMLSLLLNGLNAAVAGESIMHGAEKAAAAAEPPCHAHMDMPPSPVHSQAQAPLDDDHCRIKDCVRACAQQPALAVGGLAWLPVAHADPGPAGQLPLGHPTPALLRIQRPPIG